MGYKTLYIRDSESVRLYLDNIIVKTKTGEIRFLISDLKSLIIDNYKICLSTQLINKLTQNNVALIICDLSHNPFTQLIPLNGNYASSGIIKKQITWNDDLKQIVHQKIIIAKINAQLQILKINDIDKKTQAMMTDYLNEVQIGDATNREGLAAKVYFKALFGKNFIRFADDIINAGLNYGYAVFRSQIRAILVSKGLLLNLGIFHCGENNEGNLSDDIIEVFRPLVDNYVFNNMLNCEIFTSNHKENIIKLTNLKISYNKQLHTINNCIEMYIESIMKCFEYNDSTFFIAPSLETISNDL